MLDPLLERLDALGQRRALEYEQRDIMREQSVLEQCVFRPHINESSVAVAEAARARRGDPENGDKAVFFSTSLYVPISV